MLGMGRALLLSTAQLRSIDRQMARSLPFTSCIDGAGDIQLLHNHTILHSRTAFTDWEDPERRRHLLRLWLCPPVGRPLAPEWAQQYRSTEVGERGGIWVPGVEPNVDLEREQ